MCQKYLRELETDCAEYKSKWSEWWSKDLKKSYCERQFESYAYCVARYAEKGKDSRYCDWLVENATAAGCT
ncbi:hypothetical protein COLO4_27883 [Corchorus olitorius]|uniref:Uncharacterized protein n=1 Tax=Corchorus olitorius TaxID=93759 RepID=A0A1R3HNQ7_9ROSI|nr:hypothetical protein COLO4_27883 [Corchorus olitorius]